MCAKLVASYSRRRGCNRCQRYFNKVLNKRVWILMKMLYFHYVFKYICKNYRILSVDWWGTKTIESILGYGSNVTKCGKRVLNTFRMHCMLMPKHLYGMILHKTQCYTHTRVLKGPRVKQQVLTLLVPFVTGVLQRQADGTVMPRAVLPVRNYLSGRRTVSHWGDRRIREEEREGGGEWWMRERKEIEWKTEKEQERWGMTRGREKATSHWKTHTVAMTRWPLPVQDTI